MYRYQIPSKVETNIIGYNSLTKLFADISSQNDKSVLILFDSCSVFDANLSATLGALLDRLTIMGYIIMLNNPANRPVRRSLGRISFLKAWNVETSIQERESFIPYRRFNSNNQNEFKSYIDSELLNKRSFPKHSKNAGDKILESIFEIYANAISHGCCDFVYSCGEYKHNSHVLDMTIVDCGTTIPKKVNTFLADHSLNLLSSIETIKWAFVPGNTTKNQPGGLGLAILDEFIKLNNGALQIVSDNAFVQIRNNNVESFLLDIPFPGTIVNMSFNFDDKKSYFIKGEFDHPSDLL